MSGREHHKARSHAARRDYGEADDDSSDDELVIAREFRRSSTSDSPLSQSKPTRPDLHGSLNTQAQSVATPQAETEKPLANGDSMHDASEMKHMGTLSSIESKEQNHSDSNGILKTKTKSKRTFVQPKNTRRKRSRDREFLGYSQNKDRVSLGHWVNVLRNHRGIKQRFKFPRWLRLPSEMISVELTHYRDALIRAKELRTGQDHYLSPTDGHLEPLVVQAVDEVFNGPSTATWHRTYIRNTSPWPIRLALWPLGYKRLSELKFHDWLMLPWKWIPACLGLLLTLGLPMDTGSIRNGGRYDPVLYKDWGYAKTAKNIKEEMPPESQLLLAKGYSNTALPGQDEAGRVSESLVKIRKPELLPRWLQFLYYPDRLTRGGRRKRKVKHWRAENENRVPGYVFVAYSLDQFDHEDRHDWLALHDIGERAAREARAEGLPGIVGFWVGASCIDKKDIENDVYRISDTIRGAARVVVAVKQPHGSTKLVPYDELLGHIGKSLWILPELLLAPRGEPILVYAHSAHVTDPERLQKRELAARIFDNSEQVLQLLEHKDGTLELSRLEFLTQALKCLSMRMPDQPYLEGDLSYVLMGLQSRRPWVYTTDTSFEAFARLSLANDSDLLLERLICIQPLRIKQPWHDVRDYWEANLWDIEPTCQISGFGSNESVILDGAKAAAIRWKSFKPVALSTAFSLKRLLAQICIHGSPALLVVGIALLIYGEAGPGIKTPVVLVGAILSGITFVAIFILSPVLVRTMYTGKSYASQCWFFGFEGYADIETIENHIFGGVQRRLTWSPFGSTLSVHKLTDRKTQECCAPDPMGDETVKRKVEDAKASRFPNTKIFTLVDTLTMTVVLFEAVRPPVAILMCGREGGMQRALGCSFDHVTKTFYREVVLRMETKVLDSMSTMSRCRLGMNRPQGLGLEAPDLQV